MPDALAASVQVSWAHNLRILGMQLASNELHLLLKKDLEG